MGLFYVFSYILIIFVGIWVVSDFVVFDKFNQGLVTARIVNAFK